MGAGYTIVSVVGIICMSILVIVRMHHKEEQRKDKCTCWKDKPEVGG